MRAGYRFASTWTVPVRAERVADQLLDLAAYPSWWPQVRAVARLGPDSARLLCRSTLPYTLDLVLEAVSRDLPTLEVRVAGDLDGWVRWTLTPVGDLTRMDLRQEVTVGGVLAVASVPARPLLRWNHRRMMAGCERGLRARLGSEVSGPASPGPAAGR
ncbi:polyketide cyclase [Nocardioides sp. GY 10113]|uniref:SRPBCC family protein n=1 Tax=Nocardioides sp. GY 10113 TaxID=2569761 RepID=UPI0010A7AA21|nr:SRPBCC family protein [Nocardioides sp. GY 10113]TIC86760.1 polyketide cyclase [Nocardioides sp. GY 10113]